MHAVFLVASTHLDHLQSNKVGHEKAVHLSQVLPPFREALSTLSTSKDYTIEKCKALVACSLLLLQYSWTFDSQVWSSSVMGLYRGLKSVTHFSLDDERFQGQDLYPMLQSSPRQHIEQCMQRIGVFSPPLSALSHCLTCDTISTRLPEDPEDLASPVRRLTTILWGLEVGCQLLQDEASNLKLDAASYLFYLPCWFSDGFIRLLEEDDPRSNVIMLYYLAVISRLEDERFWWMKERAVFIYGVKLLQLENKCPECLGVAEDIFVRGSRSAWRDFCSVPIPGKNLQARVDSCSR